MRPLLTAFILLFFFLPAKAQFQRLIVNEFSQGASGAREYVELLVVGTKTCTDSTVDLREWIIDDHNGWYGAGTGNGIAGGHIRLSMAASWSAVPFGSIILIYNDADKNPLIAQPDDPTDSNADNVYILPANSTFLEASGNTFPTAGTTNPAFSYAGSTYTSGGNWTTIGLANAGDAVIVVDPSAPTTAHFSIAFGSLSGGAQTPTILKAAVGAASNCYLSNSTYLNTASFIVGTVPANETPGLPNGGANTAWINSMRLSRPTITAATTATAVCFSTAAQATSLSYSATTQSPTTYTITWSGAAAGLFNNITASLPPSPIPIAVPAGASPGSYTGTITVTNAAGNSCTPQPFTLTVQPLPTVSAGSYAPVCAGAPPIPLAGTPAGGTFSGTGVSANLFTPPGPGSYSITYQYTDPSTGCTNSATTAITVLALPLIGVSPNTAICAGSATTLTATGGHSYTWSPAIGLSASSGSTVTATPSTTTTYTVTGTDANGCSNTAQVTVTVNASPEAPLFTLMQPGCTTPTGSISITSPLGSGIGYSLDGVTFQATPSFNALAPGTYTLYVTNAGGCGATASFTINPPPPTPAQPAFQLTQPDCNTPTGTVQVTAPTGAGLSYSIDGTDYSNTSGLFSPLLPGSYSLTVRNAAGCVSSSANFIINPQPVTPQVSVNSPQVCPGAGASITATVSPAGTYTYSWTVPTGAANPGNNPSFTATVPGTYSVTVTGQGGCTASASGTLTVTPLAAVTADDKSVCTNSSVALTGQPTGGIWTGLHVTGSTFNANGVAPGNYTVTYIYTAGACSGTATATVVVRPLPPAPAVTATHPTCTQAQGSLTVTAPTGAGYSYSLDGTLFTNTTGVFTGLAAGTYTVYAQLSGCVSSASAVLNPQPPIPAAPAVSITSQPSCQTPTGSLSVTSPAAGTNHVYSINGGGSFQASPVFNALAPGVYSVVVRNSEGCLSAPVSITITAQPPTPSQPVVTVSQPTCQEATGSIQVTSPVGAAFQYSIDGVNYGSNPLFTGVQPGTYTVTVRNASGCISIGTTVQINSAPALPAAPQAALIQPTCTVLTGSIQVTAPLGAGLSYSLNGGAYQSGTLFAGLAPGTYTVSVRNSAGCASAAQSFTLLPSTEVLVSADTVCRAPGQSYVFNGQVLTASGNYTSTYTQPGRCDSTVNLYLLIASRDTLRLQGCGSLTYNGVVYSASTTLTEVIPSVLTGCDSVLRLVQLLINGATTTPLTVCLPPGQTYSFFGQTLSGSGIYTQLLTGSSGCDSLIRLELVVATALSQTLTGCGSLSFGGTTYTASTVLRDTVQSSNGCDSIYHEVNLIVHPLRDTTLTACIDAGQVYVFNGNTLTTTGHYQAQLTTTSGCDSTVRLYLLVKQYDTLRLQGCSSVTYNNTVYTSGTQLVQTFASSITGCDSLVRTVLINISSTVNTFENRCLPEGGSLLFNGVLITVSGLYRDTLVGVGGCDSIHHLQVTVAQTSRQEISGCTAVSYAGVNYTANTILRDTVRSLLTGCDSLQREVMIRVYPP
jgi:hypothetical protein